MLLFLVLFLVSALVALGFLAFGGKRVTLKEFGLQMGVQLVVCAILAAVSYHTNTGDTETWSGSVTAKTTEHVHCRHSYACNCHQVCHWVSGSRKSGGGHMSCHEHCDTCYEHRFDVDWDVQSTLGGYSIDTVDRQGLQEPPRWTATVVGEPVARTHEYTNYVKGNPDTLFRRGGDYERFKATLPPYPQRVYDYWHMDRLVVVGDVRMKDPPAVWNRDLEAVNAEMGASKQANLIFVLVAGQPREWFYALQQAWLGGKKNDIIVVMGTSHDPNLIEDRVDWVQVMAWTKDNIVKVRIQDALPEEVTEKADIYWTRDIIKESYVRQPMAEYKYLEDAVKPTPTAWAVTLIISLLVALGMGVFVFENDVFDEESWYKRR